MVTSRAHLACMISLPKLSRFRGQGGEVQGWTHLEQLEEGSDRTILFWLFVDGDSQRKVLQDTVAKHSEHTVSRRLL